VFGDVWLQVSTRLYMDHLRMQSENLFLDFLPADRREEIRASWYVGATTQVDYFLVDQLRAASHGTRVRFHGPDVKRELLEQILHRSPVVSGPPDTLNRCANPPCDRPDATPAERDAERALQALASVRGPWVHYTPEVSLLRVRVGEGGGTDLAYALVHDDAHTNVAFMFGEDERRLPADDTMSVVRGGFGAYPNFFFTVDLAAIEAFAHDLRAVVSNADYERFVARWGVRRTATRFWATSDWFREALRRQSPTRAGVLDLDRYVND
jgi:hypothetical protein